MGRSLRTGILAVAIGCIAAPAFAGAQGGYDTEPTREQFVAQADKICHATIKRFSPLYKGATRAFRKGNLKKGVRLQIRGQRVQIKADKKLERLPRPPADADRIGDWIEGASRGMRLAVRASKQLGQEHFGRYKRMIARAGRIIRAAERNVRGFGWRYCAPD